MGTEKRRIWTPRLLPPRGSFVLPTTDLNPLITEFKYSQDRCTHPTLLVFLDRKGTSATIVRTPVCISPCGTFTTVHIARANNNPRQVWDPHRSSFMRSREQMRREHVVNGPTIAEYLQGCHSVAPTPVPIWMALSLYWSRIILVDWVDISMLTYALHRGISNLSRRKRIVLYERITGCCHVSTIPTAWLSITLYKVVFPP